MGNKNTNLQAAKRARDDEFYTTYETIEAEVFHYTEQFYGKTVLSLDYRLDQNTDKIV